MSWLVVAPEREDDAALENSAWMARATAARANPAPDTLLHGEATRSNFEHRAQSAEGVAFFGHGSEERLFDADRAPGTNGPALLDEGNLHCIAEKWFHAVACLSGSSLAERAIRNGASIYVGYRTALNVSFDPALPSSIDAPFVDLITTATFALAAGERDPGRLRAATSRAADALFDALSGLPDGAFEGWMAIHVLAQQLVDEMVVACGA